jgi:hypothetical protein
MNMLFSFDGKGFGKCMAQSLGCSNPATIQINSHGIVTEWCSKCFTLLKDAFRTEPARCECCNQAFTEGQGSRCDNCGVFICKSCAGPQGIPEWRGMRVCEQCKADLTADKGPDPEDLIARMEYLEDR